MSQEGVAITFSDLGAVVATLKPFPANASVATNPKATYWTANMEITAQGLNSYPVNLAIGMFTVEYRNTSHLY
jgi:hypothetical protein